jgi:hypothetical protein
MSTIIHQNRDLIIMTMCNPDNENNDNLNSRMIVVDDDKDILDIIQNFCRSGLSLLMPITTQRWHLNSRAANSHPYMPRMIGIELAHKIIATRLVISLKTIFPCCFVIV